MRSTTTDFPNTGAGAAAAAALPPIHRAATNTATSRASGARLNRLFDAVTIAGQSGGAQDVALLLLSPRARGLFARAIQQSGTAGFGLPSIRGEEEGKELSKQLAAAVAVVVVVLVTAAAGSGAVRSVSAQRHVDLSTNAAVNAP